MKINIYYGGRGVIGDPSLLVVKKIENILNEINVKHDRYNLHDADTNITTLPQTLKDCEGIILATTVEWHGIGGYLMNFLDACWLYGDKERIGSIYMAPVVLSTTYGEKEASLDLKTAWETLGGKICEGITCYVPDIEAFEQNEKYMELIGSNVERIYRTINKRVIEFPSSSKIMTQGVNKTKAPIFTQQEAEQLSKYISDETYVNKQKNDIKEIAGFFKGKLGSQAAAQDNYESFINAFKKGFVPKAEQHVKYKIVIGDRNVSLAVIVDNAKLEVKKGDVANPETVITMNYDVLNEITAGRMTFQGAFMSGMLTQMGSFSMMRMLDELFPFMK